MAHLSAVAPTVDAAVSAAVGAALHSSDTWPPTDASTAVTDASSAVTDTSTAVADVSTARAAENNAYCGCCVACVRARWCVRALPLPPSLVLSHSPPALSFGTRARRHARTHTQQLNKNNTHTHTPTHPPTQARSEGAALTQRPLTRQWRQRPHTRQHIRPQQRPGQRKKHQPHAHAPCSALTRDLTRHPRNPRYERSRRALYSKRA